MLVGDVCKVLYDFNAVEEGELSVKKGDKVVVMRLPQDDWVMVHIGNDESVKGFVPEGYLAPTSAAPHKTQKGPSASTPNAAKNILDSFDFSPTPAAHAQEATPADPFASSNAGADLFSSGLLSGSDPFAMGAAQNAAFQSAPAQPFTFSVPSDPFSATTAPATTTASSAPFSQPPFSADPFAVPTAFTPNFPASSFPGDSTTTSTGPSPFPSSAPFQPVSALDSTPAQGLPPSAQAVPELEDPKRALDELMKVFSAPIEPSPVLPPLASFAKQELYFKRLMAERADMFQQLEGHLTMAESQMTQIREKNQTMSMKIKELDQVVEKERSKWHERLEEHQRILRARPVI